MLHIIFVTLLTSKPAYFQTCFSPDGKIICCADYVWNNETKECDECPVGYHGLKCATLCPPPSYGRLCQNECICDNSSGCDPIVGCTTRNITGKVYGDQTDPTQLILIVMSVLAVVIFLSLVFVLRKVCNRNERSESSILVTGRDKETSGTEGSVKNATANTQSYKPGDSAQSDRFYSLERLQLHVPKDLHENF